MDPAKLFCQKNEVLALEEADKTQVWLSLPE